MDTYEFLNTIHPDVLSKSKCLQTVVENLIPQQQSLCLATSALTPSALNAVLNACSLVFGHKSR